MEYDPFNDKPILLTDVLAKSFNIYRDRLQFFIAISLIYAILGELAGLILGQLQMTADEVSIYQVFINIILVSWAGIAIIYGAYRLAAGKSFLISRALVVARERYFLYLAVYITPLSIIGFFSIFFTAFHETAIVLVLPFFIVLCLYFLTLFLFADILIVTQRTGFIQAFEGSARLVRPFFWKVLAYLMVIIGFSSMPVLFLKVGMSLIPQWAGGLQKVSAVVIMPYLLIVQVVLFHEIRSRVDRSIRSIEDQIQSLTDD